MRKSNLSRKPHSVFRHSFLSLSALGSLALAACSADVTRFDTASINPANSPPAPVTQTQPSRSGLGGGDGYQAPPANGQYNTGQYSSNAGTYSNGGTYYPPRSDRAPAARGYETAAGAPGATVAPLNQQPDLDPRRRNMTVAAAQPERGDIIEVQSGDTLYSLSRRNGVSVSEMMSLNGLTTPALKPGQRLYLPASAGRAAARAPITETASVEPVNAPSSWTGTYTVQPGDSLYGIARQYNVKVSDLERFNGITDVRKVKPGQTLRLPSGGPSSTTTADASPPPSRAVEPLPRASAPLSSGNDYASAPSTSTQPTIINSSSQGSGQRVASLETSTATDASGSSSVAGSDKLRWPVTGKIVSPFGPRADGTNNDGVNIAAPMGTEVHAAEGGVVAYAGDELKGYGNLVLLRHDNGWVTAYAHADELLVKRGDRVKRGDVIARAGRTGQVDQPQLHFELRQGQRPVDPVPFMERM